ncbi:MAG: hypothetical protein MZW92_54450 [Comamonadaceae bacterium]|nr:hypothetical protein [Comamonadaceae bacterium]
MGVGEWGSLFEVDAEGNSVQTAKGLMISLIGFNMQNEITQNKEFLENCRDEAKGLILSMLCTVFENPNDQQSIANCLENHPTWAIFAGAEKGKSQKLRTKRASFHGLPMFPALRLWCTMVERIIFLISFGWERPLTLLPLRASIHPGALLALLVSWWLYL